MISPIGFYGIISDPAVGWGPMADCMVALGVRWIQLRMKGGSRADRRRIAVDLRARIPAGFHYIVNDDPQLALEVGADGVHLGQGDGSLERARSILGPHAIIGLSTHTSEQVRACCALRPTYIGMGPVFSTATKLDADPTIGVAGLKELVAVATVPAVAIGGIDLRRAVSVMGSGVQGLCAVGPVNISEDPGSVIAAFQRLL